MTENGYFKDGVFIERSPLELAGDNLAKAAAEYWAEYEKEHPRYGVIWMNDNHGNTIAIARPGYATKIQKFISKLK